MTSSVTLDYKNVRFLKQLQLARKTLRRINGIRASEYFPSNTKMEAKKLKKADKILSKMSRI